MHTVSLEVAKKLKEAGWNIETDWGYDDDGKMYNKLFGYLYPAPTLGELIRELPDGYFVRRFADKTTIYYDDGIMKRICEADTPEDAAAEAWIALQKD